MNVNHLAETSAHPQPCSSSSSCTSGGRPAQGEFCHHCHHVPHHRHLYNSIILTVPITKVNIARWSVTEVCDFIKKLPGCSDYVEDFMVQEIDGQALMLLQADHLMSAMSIKLGPALKICEQVAICLATFSWNK